MQWKEVAMLVKVVEEVTPAGDLVNVPKEREVVVNVKGVRQSEFYQAAAVGFKPEVVVEMRIEEYGDEKTLEHNGKRYSIIRTFEKNREIVELVCQGMVNKSE